MSRILKLTLEEAANIIGTHAFVLGRLGVGLRDPLTVAFDDKTLEFTIQLGGKEPTPSAKTVPPITPKIGELFVR